MYLGNVKNGSVLFTVCGMIYMLIPAIVVVLLQKYKYKEPIKKPFHISFRLNGWFAIALFTPIIIMFLSFGVSLLLPGVEFSRMGEGIIQRYSSIMSAEQLDLLAQRISSISPFVMLLMTLGQGILAACTINAVFALGEELGWRGYMLYYLKSNSLIKTSLIIGFVWGIWHFPLILMGHNYPHHPIIGVFMMIVFCVLLTPIMIYITLKTKSVIAAAVFHGSINAFAGFPFIYLVGGSDLSNGMVGYAGFIAIVVVTAGFFVFDKFVSKENIFCQTIENVFDNISINDNEKIAN
jgi:CAAX amino terminal protease family.